MQTTTPNLLLIGPRTIPTDVLGGTKVSFEQLVEFFDRSEFWNTSVVNLSRARRRSRIGRFLENFGTFIKVAIQLVQKARKSTVILFNVSPRGLLFSGPIVWWIAKAKGSPLAIRIFGGDFDKQFSESPGLIQWLAKQTFLRSDLLLFQTRQLVDQFATTTNVEWLPTSRTIIAGERRRTTCRRLLFVAQLRPEKGIGEILEAGRKLPGDIEISIYGAEMPGFDPSVFKEYANITYYGETSHDRVLRAIQEHDVLLFPTYYEGEGYPGVIIEALQLGMPVVATRWKSITELIEHETSGLLITPGSVDELLGAINRLRLDDTLVQRLSAGAYEQGRKFSGEKVNGILDLKLRNLAGARDQVACAG